MGMGFHIMASLKNCPLNHVSTNSKLNNLLNNIVKEVKFHKVGELSCNTFEDKPSSFVLLAESHISIYSNPQNGNVELDIFCCNGKDSARLALNKFVEKLSPSSFTSKEVWR